MSITYTPITDFLTKDTLPKEDPDKVILGADFSGEFDAISTAFLGAAPSLNPTFSGTVTFDTGTGNTLTATTINATDINVTGTLTVPGGDLATETYVTDQIDAAVLAPITGFDSLADVNVGSVTDGQTIVWDSTAGEWVPVAPVTDLGTLADVNVGSVTDGQTIVWDNTAGEWVPLAGNLFLDIDATSVQADSVEADEIKADSFVETAAVTTGVMDCAVANIFSATLTAPVTLSFTNVPAVDGAYACTLELTSAGNAVTWPTGVVWPAATPPALGGGKDIFVFFTRDGGTTWNGFVAGQEIG